jgi:pimeloyl-ACP methyl ester carboxylesterase
MYLRQDRLLFERSTLSAEEAARVRSEHGHAEELQFTARDGTPLHGWMVRPRTGTPCPLLIYYGGNNEELSAYIAHQPALGACALLLVNYRGYGLSLGRPSEAALLDDALLIHDAVRARGDVDAGQVSVMGRSLGSGVAVHVAARRPVSRVVLITPYDSVVHVAQKRYPYVPVRPLLKHPFDSLSRAAAVQRPALFITAANDKVIPALHSRILHDAWGGPKTWLQLPDTDHANIAEHADYWRAVADFLTTPSTPA